MRRQNARRMLRQSSRRTSTSGFFDSSPSSLSSSNSGDSSTLSRMMIPTAIRIADSRNGTRHAHWPPSGTLIRNARFASSSPTGKPAWVMPVYNPFFRHGACSKHIRIAPPHSAPNARPWTTRTITSRIPAHTPTCW